MLLKALFVTLTLVSNTDAGSIVEETCPAGAICSSSALLQAKQLRRRIQPHTFTDEPERLTAEEIVGFREVPHRDCEVTRMPHGLPATGLLQLGKKENMTKSDVRERVEKATRTRSQAGTDMPRHVVKRIAELQMGSQHDDDTHHPPTWFDIRYASRAGTENGVDLKRIFDQRPETWGSAKLLQIDLGRLMEVQATYIHWRHCNCMNADSVKLFHSMDETTWHQYAGISGLTAIHAAQGAHEQVIGKNFTARWLRLEATSQAAHYVELYEFQLFMGPHWNPRPNIYGWFQSYKTQHNGLSGTEMTYLTAYKGKLFGGSSYWMNKAAFRPAEIVRLDCPFCDWVIETQVGTYAGRVEMLKPITWTTDRHGNALPQPVDKLIALWYMNYNNAGRCYMNARDDNNQAWYLDYYWEKTPFNVNYFSARSGELYRDPVTGVDLLFLATGKDGIVAGWYDETKGTLASFPTTTETGPLETRPLSITKMDGRLYFTASHYIKRRVNGASPSWEMVADMFTIDSATTVDEAVGGIRGLSMISNPASPTGHSLLFSWNPNGNSQGCMYRLDPTGSDTLTAHKEACTNQEMVKYLGKNTRSMDAIVPYVIANYNSVLEINGTLGEKIQLIGFQALLYDHSTYEFPIDPTQVSYTSAGKRLGYFAGGGFMIRKGPTDYEVRVPGGPRYNIYSIYPKQTAVRTMAASPFDNDAAVYAGGYDANYFWTEHTAWAQRGTLDAVYAAPVPCQKELGCGHVPGDHFRTHGCDWCSGAAFDASAISHFDATGRIAYSCQVVLDWLNSPDGAGMCETAKTWGSVNRCCLDECDFCEGTGLTFKPEWIAGTGSGGNYTCAAAVEHELYSGMPCKRAKTWWSGPCCG